MSVKLQEEYGDRLQIMLVSVGNDTPDQVQAFALNKKWLGNRMMWTSEEPFETGLGYIPAAVLLDSSGVVKLIDNPIDAHNKIVELIDADLDAIKKGPKDAPDAVRKAWADFANGNYAKALAAAQALVDKPPTKDADAVIIAAKAAIEAFNKSIDKRFASAEGLVQQGQYDRALAELEALAKAVKGHADLTRRQVAEVAKINDPSLKGERDAATDLARLEKKIYEKGAEDNTAKSLRAWAEKHAGTRAAERAQRLADIAEMGAGKH